MKGALLSYWDPHTKPRGGAPFDLKGAPFFLLGSTHNRPGGAPFNLKKERNFSYLFILKGAPSQLCVGIPIRRGGHPSDRRVPPPRGFVWGSQKEGGGTLQIEECPPLPLVWDPSRERGGTLRFEGCPLRPLSPPVRESCPRGRALLKSLGAWSHLFSAACIVLTPLDVLL